MAVSVLVALALQGLVWWLLVHYFRTRHAWYGFYDISDIGLYQDYARQFARGLQPYSVVPVEYPPLAIPLMSVAQWLSAWFDYKDAFAGEMIALCAAAASLSTAAVVRLSRGMAGPLTAAIAFAATTLAAGPIVANRFDIAVALDLALFAYCISRRRWAWAAASLGIGFALKLTPALLLPLVLVLAPKPRQWLAAGVAFALAALLPFLPYLLRAPRSLRYIFTYHAGRPLQIESLYSTPYLLGHAFAGSRVGQVVIGNSHGSQSLNARGTETLASLSLWIMTASVVALTIVLWQNRRHLRWALADAPFVMLALVVIFLCTSKVLSPQFMIWTLPLIALLAASPRPSRRVAAFLLWLAVGLTQLGFPSRYWDLVALRTGPIVLLGIRNCLLLSTAVLVVMLLWRRPRRGREGS